MEHLGRKDWLRAARLALLQGGVEAVRVEKLARDLSVTKGSFYWHFNDREELLEVLLHEWETEVSDIMLQLGRKTGREALRAFFHIMVQRAGLSEQGDAPSDAAVFAWASVSPAIAARVNRAERQRIRFLARLSGRRDRVYVAYLAWLGFVARGQRLPESRRKFPQIARVLFDLLLPAQRTAIRHSANKRYARK